MEESFVIQRFNECDELPAAKEFESLIEPSNVPAVFSGCIKNWPAFSKWSPANGGLDYLQERVGSRVVEAMLSRSEPVFYGDLGSHERVPVQFSAFIGLCKQYLKNKEEGIGVSLDSESQEIVEAEAEAEEGFSPLRIEPQQIYLAQVPVSNAENEERVQLETLREDIQLPAILERKSLTSVNLWMNIAEARSSTHYDPHHNLLCIVSGHKEVFLWPPSAGPLLYPKPIYGEASNHSSVPLENPDLSSYPRAKCLLNHSQKISLHAGDAIFIPEGWFHQVDSDNLTIAINFWWQSKMMTYMSEHMDAYYLRRILRRLTDKEMDQMLDKNGMQKSRRFASKLHNHEQIDGHHNNDSCKSESMDLKEKKLQRTSVLQELEPPELQVLHELISLVHDCISVDNQKQPLQSSLLNDYAVEVNDNCQKDVVTDLKDDPVATILRCAEPHTLQNVLLAMAHNFPRTLEALVFHVLSPVGAEILTRKFDEMDQQNVEGDRNKFYEAFYSAFDDQFSAMDKILKGKELFSLEAFKNVMHKYLGANLASTKP